MALTTDDAEGAAPLVLCTIPIVCCWTIRWHSVLAAKEGLYTRGERDEMNCVSQTLASRRPRTSNNSSVLLLSVMMVWLHYGVEAAIGAEPLSFGT